MKSYLMRPFVLAVLLLSAGVALSAHLAVVKSLPAKDQALDSSPARIQVWFSQEPSVAVSAITVQGPSGAAALGKVTAGEDNSIAAEVTTPLAPGSYTVNWQSAGHDGHVIKGSIPFSVTAR
ncbi:MAG: copper resistance protein CopC [Vicinamibacterales bacterium]